MIPDWILWTWFALAAASTLYIAWGDFVGARSTDIGRPRMAVATAATRFTPSEHRRGEHP